MEATEIFKNQFQSLWPAIKGSLAKVYKPCIRKSCLACARGQKHAAWILSFTLENRRRCLYIPKALVPEIRNALKNGRKLEEMLYKMGPALVKKHRRTLKTSHKN